MKRSETVTVRLDPKLRYLAELAALKHRRTLSSFIEWAIEESLRHVVLDDAGTTVAADAALLWDVDDVDRFAKLALRYPELLTHEEQKRWKIVRECAWFWRGRYDSNGKWTWRFAEESFIFPRLREYWELVCAVARGERSASTLPSVVDQKTHDSAEESDDDIPF